MDDRTAHSPEESIERFVRDFQPLALTALGKRASALVAKKQWRKLSQAQLAATMRDAKAHVQAIVSLLTVLSSGASPASRGKTAAARMGALIARDELLPPGRFVEAMGVSRQALSKAVARQRIFFVEVGAERYFPRFYLDPQYQRREIERISRSLGGLPGASKLQFFLTGKASLGGLTPLQALAKGKAARVREVAAAFAER